MHSFWVFKRKALKCRQTLAVLVVLFIGLPFALVAQPVRPRIYGPTAIQTPATSVSYSLLPADDYTVTWKITGEGARINSELDANPVWISYLGRGENLLIATIRSPLGQLQYDTLRIRRNNCSAVMGNLRASENHVCAGENVRLFIDDLSGTRILWQRSIAGGPWQTFQTQDRPPLNELTTEPLTTSLRLRAIVQNALNCADTSGFVSVRVWQRPEAVIGSQVSDRWCTGQASGSLNASARNGTGVWRTEGTGTFADSTLGNTQYVPSEADGAAGRVTLTWLVSNPYCAAEVATLEREVFISPRSLFEIELPVVCPESRTPALGVQVQSGTGRWVQPPGSLGRYSNPTSPNATFTPHRDDAGKTLRLGWLASNGSCDTLLTQLLRVHGSPVARIAFPATAEEATVCQGDQLRLRADTVGRRGRFFWASESNQPFVGPTDIFAANAAPQRDFAVYFLTYIDPVSNCRTNDTVTLRLRQRTGGLQPAQLTACPDQPLKLRVGGIDTLLSAQWSPQTALLNPGSSQPEFVSHRDDTLYRYNVQGRSLQDGCSYRTTVDVRVSRAPQPILVDLNRRRPDRLCFGYPNVLFFVDTVGCVNRWIFRGRRDEVMARGVPGETHPLYIASDSLPLDQLAVRNEPYFYTSYCKSVTSGCERLHETSFRIVEVPVSAFEPERRLVPYNDRRVRFINRSARAMNYSWDFGDPSLGARNNSQQREPVHEFPRPGRYIVSLVADNGVCSKATFNEVEVLGEDYYFPTAFTPDGDGLNDLFRPLPAFWSPDLPDARFQLENIRIRTFQILDLSQNVVYEVDDALQWKRQLGWDGTTLDGKPADPGVYLFRAQIEQEPYGLTSHTGRLTLIR